MLPHNEQVRRLVARAGAPFLGVAILLWGLELCIFLGSARTYFPETDWNSWPVIAIAAPPVLAAMYVNFLVATILYVRAFARKKGPAKAVHYLFPKVEAGQSGDITRAFLWAAGIRPEAGSQVDSL